MQFAEALARPMGPARQVPPWPRLKWAGVALAIVLVGAAVWLRARARGSAVVPAASVIAVLPPAPIAPDTALARLGQNLVVTLSANLNGVGDLRAIDALTMLAQTQGRAAEYTLDEAAALGRRLGASGVVSGTLARDGPNVRLDLGLYAAADAAPVARAFVTASADDLNALTDSATWSLLRQVWRAGAPPTPSLAALTTRSLPALRAFLEGERAVVESRWPDAEQAFGQAIREDSTFWLAYWRYAVAKGWQVESPDPAAMSMAQSHLQDLPERERLHMQTQGVSPPALFDLDRQLTERYPDYWPGWLNLGDDLYHQGPVFGHSLEEAQQAFERAVGLNPRLLPAWDHLFWIATTLRDADLQAQASRAIAELGGELSWYYRMHVDIVRRKRFAGPLADSIVALTLSFREPFEQKASAVWFSSLYPAVQTDFSRRVLRAGALPITADANRLALAVAWAARGAWDSAMAAIDVYAAQALDSLALLDPYRFAVVGAWLGALEPEAALARRAALMGRGGPPEDWESYFTWLDGLLAVARHDSVGLHRARARLGTADHALARSLWGFELAFRGNRRVAAESLSTAWWSAPRGGGEAIFLGVNRLAAARWLAAEGDLDRAVRLLLWHQADIPSFQYAFGVPILNGVTYLEAARIEAAQGDVAQARKYYEEFLLRYDRPVARVRHLVEEARAVLVRLEGRAPVEQGRKP
jgi:tetratricopeptide (TPR) repeat protein